MPVVYSGIMQSVLLMKFITLRTCAGIILLLVTQASCVTLPAYCENNDSGACNRTEYQLIERNCREIGRLIAAQADPPHEPETDGQPFTCFDDVMLTLKQSNRLLEQIRSRHRPRNGTSSGRKKRGSIVRNSYSVKWVSPIKYKVDKGISDLTERHDAVNAAVEAWTAGTCLTFEEIPYDLNLTEPHLLFTFIFYPTCSSYIGITPQVVPQPLYLGFLCFSMGIVAHELGHALGLIHEHQRLDRDQYINILSQNTLDQNLNLFMLFNGSAIQTYGQPYDYGSSMHYRGTAYSKNGLPTIETKQPLFQSTLGQREELSFWDYYAVNQEYCSEACHGKELTQACLNHGYQDPKNCSQCRCPDGWTGKYCDSLAPPVNTECGGKLTASDENGWVTFPSHSPSTPSLGPTSQTPSLSYESGQECSWLIESRQGSRVVISFQGLFGVACSMSEGYRCLHWVEVHHREDLGRPGPRFCCNTTYTEPIVSETNRMLITFKSITTGVPAEQRGGFTFKYSEDMSEEKSTDKSVSSSPSSSTSSLSSSSTTSSATGTRGLSTQPQSATSQPTSPTSVSTVSIISTLGFFPTNAFSFSATASYTSAKMTPQSSSRLTTEGFFTATLSSPLVTKMTENTRVETTFTSFQSERYTSRGFRTSAVHLSICISLLLALSLSPVR